MLDESLHPYVVFLPSDSKERILSAIFGSDAAVDILKFCLKQGISRKIYQKDLLKELHYSNKTIIGNLKSLVKFRILSENMKKSQHDGRTVWKKAYTLSEAGKWFALLLAEKELTQKEKAEILQSLFKAYVEWARDLSKKLHLSRTTLETAFQEAMK